MTFDEWRDYAIAAVNEDARLSAGGWYPFVKGSTRAPKGKYALQRRNDGSTPVRQVADDDPNEAIAKAKASELTT